MIGVGIGIGFHTPGWVSPGILASQVSSLLGGTLVSFGVIDDTTETSGSINSAPARVGATLTPGTGANRAQVLWYGGRKFANSPSSSGKSLEWAACPAGKYFFSVLKIDTLPFGNAGYALSAGGIATPALQCTNGGSAWNGAPAGFTNYVDDVTTSVVTTGVHFHAGSKVANAVAGLQVLGLGDGYSSFDLVGAVGLWGVCNAVPDAATRTALYTEVRKYYRI